MVNTSKREGYLNYGMICNFLIIMYRISIEYFDDLQKRWSLNL